MDEYEYFESDDFYADSWIDEAEADYYDCGGYED